MGTTGLVTLGLCGYSAAAALPGPPARLPVDPQDEEAEQDTRGEFFIFPPTNVRLQTNDHGHLSVQPQNCPLLLWVCSWGLRERPLTAPRLTQH